MGAGKGAEGPLGLSPHLGGSWPADLMTEMTDLSSDLEASGIPFLDYHTYAERAFFPGPGGCPLLPELEGPEEEGRRATVCQGLTQLSNLLNSKLFLLTVRASWVLGGRQGRGPLWAERWGWGQAGPGWERGVSTGAEECVGLPRVDTSFLCSSSTPWRSSLASPRGIAAMWLHSCPWFCTASLST